MFSIKRESWHQMHSLPILLALEPQSMYIARLFQIPLSTLGQSESRIFPNKKLDDLDKPHDLDSEPIGPTTT